MFIQLFSDRRFFIVGITGLLLGAFVVPVVQAQKGSITQQMEANRRKIKSMPSSGYRPHVSRMYGRQATEGARVLYHYGQVQVDKPTATAEIANVTTNISKAQAELAKLAKDPTASEDVKKTVAEIQALYTKATEHCDMMKEHLDKNEKPESLAFCECCSDAYRDLLAAQKKHDELLKSMGIEELTEPVTRPTK